MSWHTQEIRPLTSADAGRFLVGYGLAGWISGYVKLLHGDYLVVDSGRQSLLLNGNVVIDVIQLYTFMDDPPVWVKSSFQQVLYGA